MSPVLIHLRNRRVADPGSCLLQLAAVRAPENAGQIHGLEKEIPVQFVFAIVDRPGWAGPRSATLNLRFPGWRGRTAQVLTALNSGVPVPDGRVDLEDFLGRRMRATVKATDAGYFAVIPETAQPAES